MAAGASARTSRTSIRAGEPRASRSSPGGAVGRRPAPPRRASAARRRGRRSPSSGARRPRSVRRSAPRRRPRARRAVRSARPPGRAAPTRRRPGTLGDDAAFPHAAQHLLHRVRLRPPVGVAVRQHQHGGGEAVTAEVGDLPDALDTGGRQLGCEGPAEQGAAAVAFAVGADEGERVAVGARRPAPRRSSRSRRGRGPGSRGRAGGRGRWWSRSAAGRRPGRCGRRTRGAWRASGCPRGVRDA